MEKYYVTMEGTQTQKYVAIPLNLVRFLFALRLRAHQMQNCISISIVQPLDDFQGSLNFYGHGSW